MADAISKKIGEEVKLITIVDSMSEKPEGKSIGLVFPVYSWGVPPLFLYFLQSMPEQFWENVKKSKIRVWAVLTCGDEVALTPEMLQKELEKHSIRAEAIWSIIMPNNYVLLPGFDVDSKEIENEKLRRMNERINFISSRISSDWMGTDVVRGDFKWIKTKLIYPLFKKWGIFPSKWFSTPSCVSCGICVKSCPLKNIVLDKNGHPKWSSNCCSCLACYHSCPHHSIEYGGMTKRKGQYLFPVRFRKNNGYKNRPT
ncbi:MAG: EFR1 family ferrodoxin [Muribaculaceae bacterium]|nr:EFR1 family ferrodoxin [Muribaculaceae bacterium]